MKVKVLHFLSHGRIGGQERAMYQLFRAFENDPDFEFGVVYGESGGYYLDKILKIDIKKIYLRSGSGFSIRANPKLISVLKKYSIHHFHDPSPNQILPSILCGKGMIRLFTRRGGLIDYRQYGLKKSIKFRTGKFLLKHFFQGYSGNTKTAIKYIEKFLKFEANNYLLYNGLDFSLLLFRKPANDIASSLGLSGSNFIIGTACQLVKLKRVDLLVRAFHLAGIPGSKLIIFGKGIEESVLRNLAREIGAESTVLFAGEVKNMPDYMQILNCYVQPSGHEESFGNALVEAMYLKIPSVIMKDGGGMLEHIEEGQTGWIAQDLSDLALKIRYIWANQEVAKAVACRASEYVLEKYSIANMIRSYKMFYRSVLSQKDSDNRLGK